MLSRTLLFCNCLLTRRVFWYLGILNFSMKHKLRSPTFIVSRSRFCTHITIRKTRMYNKLLSMQISNMQIRWALQATYSNDTTRNMAMPWNQVFTRQTSTLWYLKTSSFRKLAMILQSNWPLNQSPLMSWYDIPPPPHTHTNFDVDCSKETQSKLPRWVHYDIS